MGTRIIVDLSQKVGTFSADTTRYLRTHIKAVDGLLDGSDLIDINLLPASVKYGLKMIGSVSYTASTMDGFDDIWANAGLFDAGDNAVDGYYVNVDVGGVFNVPAGHIILNGDDGGGSLTGGSGITIELEKNDWIVFKGIDGSSNKTWSIVNHNYPEATTTAAGLMSASDKVKLNGLSNYTHPTFTPTDQDLTDIQTIDTITFGANGHISAITKQAIRSASESATGILRLATQAEVRQSLGTSHVGKAISRERAIDVMKYFPVLKLYEAQSTGAGNLSDANASTEHGEGAFVLIKTGTVTV